MPPRHTDLAVGLADYLQAIESGRLFGLPLGLVELLISDHAYFNRCTLVLPPQLRHLTLPAAVSNRRGFLELLPPTLTHLETGFPQYASKDVDPKSAVLYKLTHLRHLAIRAYPSIDPEAAHVLRCVPPSLTSLGFEDVPRTAVVSPAHLHNLPPNLNTLEIVAQCRFAKAWLRLIPRSVARLKTPHLLEGTDFCNLPPHIRTLEVGMTVVKLSHFWTLPPSLLSFRRWGMGSR